MKSLSLGIRAAPAKDEEFELATARGVRRLAIKVKNFLRHHGFFGYSIGKKGESRSPGPEAGGTSIEDAIQSYLDKKELQKRHS